MKIWMRYVGVSLLALSTATLMKAQDQSTTNDLVDRITKREMQEVDIIRKYNPIVETYIQDMQPNPEFGSVPVKDHYFLGVADFRKHVLEHSLLEEPGKRKMPSQLRALALAEVWPSDLWSSGIEPLGLLEMVFVEKRDFDTRHYRFDYVRREFLGEVRCFVMDVTPLPHSGQGRFKGRIWVEEHDYTIVRFNGIYEPISSYGGYNMNFDSWRSNLAPGVWLPTYVYSEEAGYKENLFGTIRYKSQMRLWGYHVGSGSTESEFSKLSIDAPGAVLDQGASPDLFPLGAQRQWQREAENNVLDLLQRSGLLAPAGPVDKVLDTVVNNIEVTNNLDVQPEVRCRVLLTSTLESFSIGHAIVISRGLLDVLPDEASLAVMLTEQLGSVLLTEPNLDKWGFNAMTNIPVVQVIASLNFRENSHDLELANQKALELLLNSPYKDKLSNAGLFLRQLSAEQQVLPSLVQPRLGNHVFLADKIMSIAPPLDLKNANQTAALPLGGRIKINPWNDELAMLQGAEPRPMSPREKMPFEVTPFEPSMTYFKPVSATTLPENQGPSSPAPASQSVTAASH